VRKKKIETLPIDEAEGVSSNSSTPEAHYIDKERSQRINQAVSELRISTGYPLFFSIRTVFIL
jgi:RNA polymerase sigma-70 factor (ECF subfamily)